MTAVGEQLLRFEFATAARIIFGAGRLQEAGTLACEFGRRALVVTGNSAAALQRAKPLLDALAAGGVDSTLFSFAGEPTVETVQLGTQRAREIHCDLIVGFGGGSLLDAAKAVAALLPNSDNLLEYLEVIGQGKPLTHPSTPCIAIPTTAGTGAEVTRNAVLTSPRHRLKVSLRSLFLLPRLAVVDPEATYSLPPSITASTGLDALTQLIEPFVSSRANPMIDAICREGMRRIARSLQQVCERGNDATAREDMALASLFGGLALANAGLGAVHGLAAPLGGMFPIPHGVVCANLLPEVMEMNLHALQQRLPTSRAIQRYAEIACILTENAKATAADVIGWIRDLCHDLDIPALSTLGVKIAELSSVAEKAAASSSMKANPVTLTREEMREILTRAM